MRTLETNSVVSLVNLKEPLRIVCSISVGVRLRYLRNCTEFLEINKKKLINRRHEKCILLNRVKLYIIEQFNKIILTLICKFSFPMNLKALATTEVGVSASSLQSDFLPPSNI